MSSQIIHLHGLRILVTRPKPQGGILCQKIREHGGFPLYLPTIDILPPHDVAAFQKDMTKLGQYDWAIFISPQAVYQSADVLPSFPTTLKIAAVGAKTAQALVEKNITVHAYPENNWSSEGLLNLPAFQNLAGQKIALIKGEGGRKWLAEELAVRGANVTEILAYQRALPIIAINKWLDLLRDEAIDVIICTSNDGLQNLHDLLKAEWSKLQSISIVVVSERMIAFAQDLGLKNILLAQNASHEAILAVLSSAYAKDE